MDTPPSLRATVDAAIPQWEDLTGFDPNARSWRLGDMEVRDMHETLQNVLQKEPEGTTAAMLLECFLRAYLETKTFTAAQIMRDYKATTAYLQKAEALFSLVQSDTVVEATAAFRARVLEGARRYGACTTEVESLVADADALPFLRRDALFAIERLEAFQFLAGEEDTAPPQVIPVVHQTWDITAMLEAVRAMPVSGIAVVLVRDAAHPDRSHFGFAVRNGGNVIFVTDKSRPAYPGQEDVLAARGGRGTGRTYAARAWRNRFPYQIIKTRENEDGDLLFDAETAPVLAGLDVVPMMHMRDLPADQIIWLTMVISLVADKFWKKGWRAPQLSYTGAMIADKERLVRGADGALVAQAAGYTPIPVDTLTHEDVARDAFNRANEGVSKGVHAWMERRYAAKVPVGLLNLWHDPSKDGLLLIPKQERMSSGMKPRPSTTLPADPNGVVHVPKGTHSWDMPSGYPVVTFAPSAFGSAAEIQADRVWIARRNMASYVQKLADEEYADRKAEILAWVKKKMEANLPTLLTWLADEAWPPTPGADRKEIKDTPRITVAPITSSEWRFGSYPNLVLGGSAVDKRCALDGTKATWRVRYSPKTAADLAQLCGLTIDRLPDVLQEWDSRDRYVGNHLLNRLDPMDTNLKDPWSQVDFCPNVFLSKRAYARSGGKRVA